MNTQSATATDCTIKRLWIVIVNYNGLEDTRKCMQSLQAARDPGISVVLIDNGSSTDPTASLASEFPWCHFVRNAANGGWAGGNNTGIRYALDRGAEQVLLLNNDTTVSPRLFDALRAAAGAHPGYGILGPVIHAMDDPATVMTDGVVFNRAGYPGFFERKVVPLGGDGAPITEVDIVNGCCMMIARCVFERIGLIDERFFLIHEESDFCLRARKAGFRCGVIGSGLIWHKGSVSFKRTGRRTQRYYDARNLYLLLTKHARHHPGRRLIASLSTYFKYIYYRYSIERENDSRDAADAVLEGVYDALAGHYGPLVPRRRWGLRLLRGLFEACRSWRTRAVSLPEGLERALAVRQG